MIRKLYETTSHTMWGHPRRTGYGGEVWQNVVHWRREWQTTSVFLPWEPHEQYEKAKRCSVLAPSFEKPLRHESEVEEGANAQAEAQKKKDEAEVQVSLYTHGSHRSRNKGSQRPGTPLQIAGLHAYHLELVSGGLEHLWPFWSPWPPLRDLRHIKAVPFGPLPWTCDNYGLVLFSVVAECNVYNKSSPSLS